MGQAITFKACKAPLMMQTPRGIGISVPCGKCDWCVRNRRNDLAGRAIVEAQGAAYCAMITATYRNNPDGSMPEGALDFVQDHLSLFIRYERQKGKVLPGGLRYLATGERGPNGSKRCHYHIFMIFKDGRPKHWPAVLSSSHRVHLPTWKHGHVTITENNDHARLARYVAFYAYKGSGPDAFEQTPDGPRRLFAGPFFSRNPVLGHDFAVSVAREYVDQGLVPHDASYSLKGQSSVYTTGRFYFRGTLRDVFVSAYVHAWRERYGAEPLPSEFVMEKFYDPIARAEMARDDTSGIAAEIAARPRVPAASIQFDLDEQDAVAAAPDVATLAITVCRLGGSDAVLTALSDKTATLEVEGRSLPFLLQYDAAVSARVQLRKAGFPPPDARALGSWLNKHWWQHENKTDLAQRRAASERAARRRQRKAAWVDCSAVDPDFDDWGGNLNGLTRV